VARRWYRLGAQRLHVVDLDGSLQGGPRNRALIKALAKAVPIPIQLGGGIRDTETMDSYFEAGVSFLIVGTLVLEAPEVVEEACGRWPGRILAAVDARKGEVMMKGWTASSRKRAVEVARSVEALGVAGIIYTDVERDGMGRGINLEATRELAEAVGVPVIASGGVASVEDLRALMSLGHPRIIGVIVGRALYTGAFDLKEALRLTRGGKE